MLMNQATALQTLFARLAERGMGNDNVGPFEANMRMALRAQSQCRATLETLAAIKNPPVIYARQANVTTGPQQVNNGVAAHARARENESERNEQSEVAHELLPDIRTSGATGGGNQGLETRERSTGPTSIEGKAKAARNAFKGGWRRELREIALALRTQEGSRKKATG